MKSIVEYIHTILESGHAVSSQPIPAYITPLIYKEIEDKVHAWKNSVKMAPLGSVGKKKDDDFNGDIDIAIDLDNREELMNMIKEVFPESELNPFTTPKIVSIGYEWDKEGKKGVAQVDLCLQIILIGLNGDSQVQILRKEKVNIKLLLKYILFNILYQVFL